MQENNRLYVGNLPYSVTDDSLSELFSNIEGVEVTEARVITDKFSGRSKGFGFVSLASGDMADKAINEMNGKDIEGRQLVVNVARPMEKRDNDRR